MALDNAQFISELSIIDPPGSDPLSQGDDQIRTTKRATFQSFPFIDKQVDLTADQINLAAIKNEANVFTESQTINANSLIIDDAADANNRTFQFQVAGFNRWQFQMQNPASNRNFRFRRFDSAGNPIDIPWECDATTGIINFAQVPTINGSQVWVAGELRMLAQGSSLPGGNWFVANGTNGTIDLRDRFIAAEGTLNGNQSPFINATAAAGTTGSTALSEAQMPAHTHTVYRTNNPSGGITDAPLNTTDNVVGGRRNDSSKVYSLTNGTRNILGDAGSGSSHNHSSPAQNVELDGTDQFQCVPYGYFAVFIQYVP